MESVAGVSTTVEGKGRAMGVEKIHDFKNIGHRTMAQMAQEVLGVRDGTKKIEEEAEAQGHDGFVPVPVTVTDKAGHRVIRGQGSLAPSLGKRGQVFVFEPTHDRVTVLRHKVGNSYAGDVIHEVVNKDGHKFLASERQLKKPV
jgi:hypothetical protein